MFLNFYNFLNKISYSYMKTYKSYYKFKNLRNLLYVCQTSFYSIFRGSIFHVCLSNNLDFWRCSKILLHHIDKLFLTLWKSYEHIFRIKDIYINKFIIFFLPLNVFLNKYKDSIIFLSTTNKYKIYVIRPKTSKQYKNINERGNKKICTYVCT